MHAADFQWEVPEQCPDVRALEREAEREMGRPLAEYPLRVQGLITHTHADASLHLSLHITLPNSGETRERELQAISCQELLEAAAVAIALAAADSGEPTNVVQARDSERLNQPPPPLAAGPSPRSELSLSASGASNVGALPQLGLGMDFQLAWMFDWLRIGAGVSWFPLRSMQLDNTSASFGMYFVELLLCVQQRPGSIRLFGCANAGVGSVSAHLDGAEPVHSKSTGWRAMGGLIGVSYPLFPPLELTASLAGWVPLTRPRFYITPDASQTLHEPSAFVAQLLLGLVFSL